MAQKLFYPAPPLPEIIEVTSEDIEQMEAAFNCPMSDITSRNAIAIALERVISAPPVRVQFCEERRQACARIGDLTIPLPEEVALWLGRALRGIPVSPRLFHLHTASNPTHSPTKPQPSPSPTR